MPGKAPLLFVGGAPLLRPGVQAFEAMLVGRRDQQLARNLAMSTIEDR